MSVFSLDELFEMKLYKEYAKIQCVTCKKVPKRLDLCGSANGTGSLRVIACGHCHKGVFMHPILVKEAKDEGDEDDGVFMIVNKRDPKFVYTALEPFFTDTADYKRCDVESQNIDPDYFRVLTEHDEAKKTFAFAERKVASLDKRKTGLGSDFLAEKADEAEGLDFEDVYEDAYDEDKEDLSFEAFPGDEPPDVVAKQYIEGQLAKRAKRKASQEAQTAASKKADDKKPKKKKQKVSSLVPSSAAAAPPSDEKKQEKKKEVKPVTSSSSSSSVSVSVSLKKKKSLSVSVSVKSSSAPSKDEKTSSSSPLDSSIAATCESARKRIIEAFKALEKKVNENKDVNWMKAFSLLTEEYKKQEFWVNILKYDPKSLSGPIAAIKFKDDTVFFVTVGKGISFEKLML